MADFYKKVTVNSGGGGGAVTSVNGQTGDVVLTKSSIGLSNVNNTSDANKPVSTAQQAALDLKLSLNSSPDIEPDGNTGGFQYLNLNEQVKPLQSSPDESWNFFQHIVNIDPDSSGFDIGTNGTFGNIFNIGFNHQGTSDIGNAAYFNTYSSIGNGTDPISVKGLQCWLGFGNISAGVTIADSIQGFGLQISVNSAAVMNGYFSGFYDNMNFDCSVGPYNSFSSNPQLAEIRNNNTATSFNSNPTIDLFTGNASFIAYAMSGQFNLSGSATGGVQGVTLNPTITNFGASNFYNGVYSSTANISGAGTNKWAGYFEGDVNITGSLTFGGALSIGKLQAFASQNVIDGGGTPTSIHSLISDMVIPANATTANADTLGVNTAALMHIGDNSTTTSGALGIGLVGLALPAVVETGTGSTIDYIGGAAFALNFSGTSTGGTVDQGYGGMFVPIPNGITTVNRWYGMWARSPFGNLATDNWGVYSEDAEKNYFEGSVIIGDSDTPDACAALEVNSTTKGFLNARMTTAQRNAITAVNGLQIYNTTTDKLQVYSAGVWVDLH